MSGSAPTSRTAASEQREDELDTTAKTGTSVFQAIMVVAKVDRNQRGERARSGMKAAKQRGQQVCRSPKLNDAQALLADERVNAGEEPADVARSLGVISSTAPPTLRHDDLRIFPRGGT